MQSANRKKGFHKNAPLYTFEIINRVGGNIRTVYSSSESSSGFMGP